MAMTARASNIGGTLIAEKRNGSRRFHAHDSLGSTIALVNDSSKETDTYTYWPYGEIRTSTGSTSSTPFKFCGAWGYYDDGNQLYVRARYLRTQLGRWITRDPLWPRQSAYAYCRNCPISFIDPSGTQRTTDPINGSCLPNCWDMDPCEWAKITDPKIGEGLPQVPGDFLGWVVCCEGVPHICVEYTGSSSTVRRCLEEHERYHLGDWSCTGQPDGVLGAPNWDEWARGECRAYQATIKCLVDGCPTDSRPAQCHAALCAVCNNANFLCNLGRTPLPKEFIDLCNKHCFKDWK